MTNSRLLWFSLGFCGGMLLALLIAVVVSLGVRL